MKDQYLVMTPAREAGRELIWLSCAAALLRWLDLQGDLLRVLLYHRVTEVSDLAHGDPNLLSATPPVFDAQMHYLSRHYHPIGVQALLDALQRRTPLPPRAVLVTFDDGYRDFQTHAWPILRKHHIPCVLFVPTAFPDSGRIFWWDALHHLLTRTRQRIVTLSDGTTLPLGTDQARSAAVRQMNRKLRMLRPEATRAILDDLCEASALPWPEPPPMLGWNELRQLARDGVRVASHTRTHAAIPTLTEDEFQREVMGSQRDLQRELGEAVPLFSYPLGMVDNRATDVLGSAGIVAAFTDTPGQNSMGRAAPLQLRRRAISNRRSFADFSLNLTSFYSLVQERSAHRRRKLLAT